MKKIIAWFTKGTKISNILTYIYKGLIVVQAGFDSAVEKLKVAYPDLTFFDVLEEISEYVKVALEALEKILSWLGCNVQILAREAREEAEAKIFKVKDNCPNTTTPPKESLSEIVDKLKNELK